MNAALYALLISLCILQLSPCYSVPKATLMLTLISIQSHNTTKHKLDNGTWVRRFMTLKLLRRFCNQINLQSQE